VFWKKENIVRWIEMGRNDTAAALRGLVKVA